MVRFWDLENGKCVTETPKFSEPINHLQFSKNYLIAANSIQLSAIRWEPFELISQIEFDLSLDDVPDFSLQMNSTSLKNELFSHSRFSWTLLDLKVSDEAATCLIGSSSTNTFKMLKTNTEVI